MAGSVNKVIVMGNLGRDPEVRMTQNNQKIVHLSIATSERWRDRQTGEQREKTEWHRVVIFNENLADIAERYLTKGRTVYVEGQLQTRKWQDQSGQDRYSTEIILQRFRGELVLVGGRDDMAGGGGGGGRAVGQGMGGQPMDDQGGGAQGGNNNQGNRPASGGQQGSGSQGGGGVYEDLDDDIPF